MSLVGCRVVRGPYWCWDKQDGGEGHIGTVTEQNQKEQTVIVLWDSEATDQGYIYSVGNDIYELIIFDNSQTGICHSSIQCDGCETPGFTGFRWSCNVCDRYDLCTLCYMTDKHTLKHSFIRYDHNQGDDLSSNYTGVNVSARCYSTKKTAYHLKPSDWNNGDKKDTISYYRDHLPVAGVPSMTGSCTPCTLAVGDRVTMAGDIEEFKEQQENHGGWNDQMGYICNSFGTVLWCHKNGDCEILLTEEDQCTWQINSNSLTKIGPFNVGDKIQICEERDMLQVYQSQMDLWIPELEEIIGESGTIVDITEKGNLNVAVKGTTYEFNPLACVVIESDEEMAADLAAEESAAAQARPLVLNDLTSPSGAADSTGEIPSDGFELAAMMVPGAKIKRGRNWKWGNEDKNGIGTVVEPVDQFGVISVKWDGNTSNDKYRMGADNKFDLTLSWDTVTVPEPSESPGESVDDLFRDYLTMDSLRGSDRLRLDGLLQRHMRMLRRLQNDSDSGDDASSVSSGSPVVSDREDNEEQLIDLSSPPSSTSNQPHQIRPDDQSNEANSSVGCGTIEADGGTASKTTEVCTANGATSSDHNDPSTNSALNSTCAICFDLPRDVVFVCGHGTCEQCARRMRKCHICRKKIKRIIKIF